MATIPPDEPNDPAEHPTTPREEGPGSTRPLPQLAVIGVPATGTLVATRTHHYQIIRPLGKGASAQVMLARCLTRSEGDTGDIPPDLVALKFISLNGYTAFAARRELSALRVLRSPRIPRVWDWDVAAEGDGHAFFVMSYHEKGSLSPSPTSPLEAPRVVRLLHDLLAALNTAHGAGFLHLDIKPGNVLDDGAEGFVLTDFGLTQPILASSAQTLTLGRGTPGFRAPEQRDRANVRFDIRTDLFGVGATVWAMAVGVCLTEPSLDGTSRPIWRPQLREVRNDLPPWLSDVVEALLQEEPSRRPGSAAEVLTLVRFLMAGGIAESRAALGKLPFPTEPVTAEEAADLARRLMDPLWAEVLGSPEGFPLLVHVEPGVEICQEGSEDYATFVLLEGELEIRTSSGRQFFAVREGTFIGEVSALTGTRRTATVRTTRRCCLGVFNPAELDAFLLRHPTAAHRLAKLLAERLAHGSGVVQ